MGKHSIPYVSRSNRIPLSFAQQRLWFLDQWEAHSAVYTIPTVLRSCGPLQIEAFQAALHELVTRHESLRTIFPGDTEAPQQQIQAVEDGAVFPLRVTDLREEPQERRPVCLQQLIAAETAQPFDLAQGPLMRAHAIQTGETEWVVIFMLHHIIADGWSREVLFRELSQLYTAQVSGTPAMLPPLPI